jgi:hypothetical protein
MASEKVLNWIILKKTQYLSIDGIEKISCHWNGQEIFFIKALYVIGTEYKPGSVLISLILQGSLIFSALSLNRFYKTI